MELAIQIESPDRQLDLFGPADNNLRLLRNALGVQITARHATLMVRGPEENVARAAQVIDKMQKHLSKHRQLTQDDVSALLSHEPSPPAGTQSGEAGLDISVYSRKKHIGPVTKGQEKYVEAMLSNDITFCIGPAGTGKTYLAVAVAVSMLKKGQIRRIVLARPAVEAGERLGFLPGDIQAKVNPYLRPLFDSLEDMMEFAHMKKLMDMDIIEVIPLAFMRGRTLNDAAIICDEAQNTSSLQMLMVLTRLGHGSKMIITGDITQIDLGEGESSGMVEAIEILRRIKGIAVVELARQDIVRHRLVQNIVRAYKKTRSPRDSSRKPKGGDDV